MHCNSFEETTEIYPLTVCLVPIDLRILGWLTRRIDMHILNGCDTSEKVSQFVLDAMSYIVDAAFSTCVAFVALLHMYLTSPKLNELILMLASSSL